MKNIMYKLKFSLKSLRFGAVFEILKIHNYIVFIPVAKRNNVILGRANDVINFRTVPVS